MTVDAHGEGTGLSKLPAIQFYTGDHLKDPGVRSVSYAARGLWVDMVCLMSESERRGFLILKGRPIDTIRLARITGGTPSDVEEILAELEEAGVFSRDPDGVVYNRRMVRDEEKRRRCSEAGKRGGGNPSFRARAGCGAAGGCGDANESPVEGRDTGSLPDDSKPVSKGYPKGRVKGESKPGAKASSSIAFSSSPSETPPVSPGGETTPPSGMAHRSGKRKYGDHVLLSGSEHARLIERFGPEGTADWIERVNRYARQIGAARFRKRYASHYDTILNWHQRDREEKGLDDARPSEPKPDAPDHAARFAEYRRLLDERDPGSQREFRQRVIGPLRDELQDASWRVCIEPLRVVRRDLSSGTLVLFHENAAWVEDTYRDRIAALAGAGTVVFTGETEDSP